MIAGLVVLMAGCGAAQPTSVGGKPVDYWVRALHDPDARLRKRAALKLGNAGSVDATVIPALIETLQDRDPGVRAQAVLALLRMGPAAREASQALQERAVKDWDATVRAYAVKALEKVQQGS
jgi:HEAT repeat protein